MRRNTTNRKEIKYSPLPFWVLVTMRPGAPSDILSVRHRDVEAVEGAEKFVCAPEFLEDLNHLGLGSRLPSHLLMGSTVAVVHATLETDREVLSGPSRRVFVIKAKFELLQPLNLLIAVILSFLRADNILDKDAASLVELISPIAVNDVGVKVNQVLGLELSSDRLSRLDCGCGGHIEKRLDKFRVV